MIGRLGGFLTTAIMTMAAFALWATAGATVVCTNLSPTDRVCTNTPQTATLNLQQQVIGTGSHMETFTFDDVPDGQRREGWFLGNPAIQSCRFCLTPNRQNMARKRELDRLNGAASQ